MAFIPFGYSFRNLWIRRVTTLLTAGGIALVIFVFAAVLMLAYGLEKTLVGTGSDENAIVVRRGAESEFMSMIDRPSANIIKSQPEIAPDREGKPLAAAEVVVLINLPKRGSRKPSHVQIRGVSSESLAIRPQIKLKEGRLLKPGLSEAVVGAAVAKRFQGIGLGETIRFGMRDWTVVGLFEAEGSGFESEIWIDSEQLVQAFRRPVFSSVTLRLASPADFDSLKKRLESDPRMTVEVKQEKRYYSDQSEMMATFIRVLGVFVTVIFSVGAMIGAMITMYASVAARTMEIGTLRALGFSRRSILLAFLIESLFLSLLGGGPGLILASFLQTVTVSTTNFATFSELAFRFALSPAIVLESIFFALAMGLLGGFLPATRAARQNIVEAFRAA
ncbi:MAG TPA: ABC transporter permease [Candidatus Manganitrophaceae bacterium]|nr:ABC transporter permease [Candidatus Manganitrophaceae bacterium]